ncbi:MAG: hypothetical protein AVDCRST_MAG40-3518, partial [uncultured Gemmatimonadaceae bacterium]
RRRFSTRLRAPSHRASASASPSA